MPTLSDMPEVVMKEIMDNLDYRAILILRKVSHDLRNFIDDVQPEVHIKKMSVFANDNSVRIGLQESKTGIPIHIEYKKLENQCLITSGWAGVMKQQKIEDSDHMKLFCQDFEIILSHLKSTVLESLDFNAPEVPDMIAEVFKTKKTPLKVQILVLKSSNQDQIMKVLPFIDANFLDKIIINPSNISQKEVWSIDRLVELEQWKKAKVMDMISIFSTTSITKYSPFWRANFYLDTVSTEDVVSLKEALLKPRPLRHIMIGYYNDAIEMGKLHEMLGSPYFENEERKGDRGHWFWKIPDFHKILRLRWDMCKSFSFCHVEAVPPGAILN